MEQRRNILFKTGSMFDTNAHYADDTSDEYNLGS